MKRLFFIFVALLFTATAGSSLQAMTPEQMQASSERVEKLKVSTPKPSGIAEFDQLSAQSKIIADATVAISTATKALTAADVEKLQELAAKVKTTVEKLGEVGKLMGNAANALKELKNPLKIKPATNQISYSKNVVAIASEELTYQGQLIAALLK